MVVLCAAALVPIINGWGNILTRRLRGLHENTVSCYLNPVLLVIMTLVVVCKAEVATTWELVKKCGWIELILFLLLGSSSVFL